MSYPVLKLIVRGMLLASVAVLVAARVVDYTTALAVPGDVVAIAHTHHLDVLARLRALALELRRIEPALDRKHDALELGEGREASADRGIVG